MRQSRRKRTPHHSALTELNVTPLLDLAFVLLIIFMITTPLVEKTVSIDIPTSDTASQSIDADTIKIIEVDKEGKIFLEGEKLEPSMLDQRLVSMKHAKPDSAVVVRGDQILKLQELIRVIDIIQKAGITKFGIVTTPH
ncbi:MAG: biopolymer transporter ExbD [Verrucomicrobiota bacterium]|nr:biopolymer transporter ExbD [Verrucomicrobiota bacterium]